MQQISTSQPATPNFGTVVQGNHPKQYTDQLGLLTYATNYTYLQLYIDPTRPVSYFFEDLSCFDYPELRCTKSKNPPFNGQAILCLAVTNPQSSESDFTLAISFTYGVPLPVIPSSTPVTSSLSTVTTATVNPSTNIVTSTLNPTNVPPPFYALGVSGNGGGDLW
ncbi:3130_t:CDS:1, partial [Acaulospora colombiana]